MSTENQGPTRIIREVVPANPAIKVGMEVTYSIGSTVDLVALVEAIDDYGFAILRTAKGKEAHRHTSKLNPAKRGSFAEAKTKAEAKAKKPKASAEPTPESKP